MFAIFKRELKSYFDSVIGYIFLAVMIFISCLYVSYYNLQGGYTEIVYALNGAVVVMFICVSILSMKVLAEEKRGKTDQLILTAPVSVGKIVIGKFMALLSVLTMFCGVLCLIPLYLNRSGFGDGIVPMKENYTAILGFYIYSAACLAIGLFISSLTESQVLSAVITFAVLFISYMMESIVAMLPDSLEKVGKVLAVFSMSDRFFDLVNGTFDIKALLYFVSIIVIMIYLTIQSIQKRRYSVSVKNLSLSSYNVIMTVAIIAIVVIANLAVSSISSSKTEIDVTSNKMYTLSDDTKTYAKNVDKNIKIYILAPKDNSDETVVKTVKSIADLSDKISYEFVNLTEDPMFYKDYTDDASDLSTNDLLVVCGDSSKIISYDDIYEYSYDSNYQQQVSGYDAEGQILMGMDYVINGVQSTVYTLSGHSEASLDSNFSEVLEKLNMDVQELTLLNSDAVPDDASCILINCPKSDISEDDLSKLEDYINKGGNLLLNLPGANEFENLTKLTELYGVKVENNLICDIDQDHYYNSPFYLIPDIASTDYTSDVAGDNILTFVPYSYEISLEDTDNVDSMATLTTSDSSITYDVTTGDTSSQSDATSYDIGVACELTNEDASTSKMILYASDYIFTNDSDAMVGNGNQKLFKDNISSIIPEAENKISVETKTIDNDYLTVKEADINSFRAITVYFIPIIILLTGFITWLSRRRR